MFCYKCKNKLDLPNQKINFRQTCPFCLADLYICKNCTHYIIGKPNDCNVPNTEFVSDREKYNFCEDFKFKENLDNQNKKTKKEISKKLFKNLDDNDLNNNSFNSLFKY